MPRWRLMGLVTLAGLPLAALACNALNGSGDLTSGCDGCNEVDARPRDEDVLVLPDASRDGSANADVTADVMARPSFCQGIVMYLRFDDTLRTAQGIDPDSPPVVSFVPGRFGSGALLTGTNAALYYVEGDGGVPYPRDEGTVAMWLKPQWAWPPTVDRVVWKPVVDRTVNTNASGPSMRSRGMPPAFFGSTNNEPGVGGLNEDVGGTGAELAPYWHAAWNHLAETWSKSSPTITFTLNGGDGDPATTHRETDAGWTPQAPTVKFIRLSSNSFPADAAYDDFAIWSRSLSLAEVQAVYRAGTPLGDLCGL
jgi:hypothetical protein